MDEIGDCMKIAVRMDDICPGMNWEKFHRFYGMLKNKGIRPLLGVVPANRDENLQIQNTVSEEAFWERMKELQEDGCAIALHGYDHIYTTSKGGIFPLNHFAEFAGVSYWKQKEKIEQGKRVLEEHHIFTDIFMAPAHAYDSNTLRALKECGFNRITDGFGLKPYRYSSMTFYPIAFKQNISLKRKKGYTTFVVHSNTMKELDFSRWENLLMNVDGTAWISYSELLAVTPKQRNGIGRSFEKLLANVKHILVKL